MENLIRALIYDEQVSLTLADTTEVVNEGIRRHHLSPSVAVVFGKAISIAAFLSACLKNEKGDISFSFEGQKLGVLQAAGNRALFLRACVGAKNATGTEAELLGKEGALTVVRDDGYNRPFVGSCAFPEEISVDRLFEEYFAVSEQLPTFLATVVELNEAGEAAFAGVAALQPLPFTDTKTLNELPKGERLREILKAVKDKGTERVAKEYFSAKSDGIERRTAAYQCNCSRKYLSEVLVTLGEGQIRNILAEEGKISVHCQFCNTDYVFTETDIDGIFQR